jgi:hypothetical protein
MEVMDKEAMLLIKHPTDTTQIVPNVILKRID